MSRKDLFAKANEAHKQKWDNEDNAKGGDNSFTPLPYTALSTGNDKVVRLLGAPVALREKSTDPKLFYVSMISGDNDKKFRCIFPDKKEQPGWLLWKILDLVLAGSWEGDEKKHTHKDAHPAVFEMVYKNGLRPEMGQRYRFEKGWYPSKMVAMNVIDRHDPEFHAREKSAKLLSKNGNTAQNGATFYEPGISDFTYRRIWESVVAYHGDWEDYDVVIRKTSTQPFYEAFHGESEKVKLQDAVKDLIVEGPLTDEEKGYGLIDIDKYFPVTSMMKIKNRLGASIRRIDSAFGKNFTEELNDLAADEERRMKESESSPKPSTATTTVTKPSETLYEQEDQEESVEEKPAPRRRRPAATEEGIPWDKLTDGTYNDIKYLGVPKLTDEEKAMVTGVKEDGTFEYVSEWNGEPVDLYELDSNPEFLTPGQFRTDPLTGDELPPIE